MSSVIGLTKIGDVHVTLGNVGGTIRRLASLERDQPEMSEKIKVKCHACGTAEFEVHRLAESWCACDACCENWDKEEVMSKIRDYWADFCRSYSGRPTQNIRSFRSGSGKASNPVGMRKQVYYCSGLLDPQRLARQCYCCSSL